MFNHHVNGRHVATLLQSLRRMSMRNAFKLGECLYYLEDATDVELAQMCDCDLYSVQIARAVLSGFADADAQSNSSD